jgi:N-acetylmuramoyl-L-alanine amidase
MPSLFLSPSTQEYNPYVTGTGSEEYYMNRLADAMEPYLRANGISYTRNDPNATAAAAVRQANQGNYDFYLALHSNASGAGSEGQNRGIIAFYYPTSSNGKRAAELFAANLRNIYPLPDLVTTRATTSLIEVRGPRAPAVLLEIGYHDNYADAVWVETNLSAIAQNLVLSLTEYFGQPFVYPQPARAASVATPNGGNVNLRSAPGTSAPVVARLPNGAKLTVYGSYQGWYAVAHNGHAGFVSAAYVTV